MSYKSVLVLNATQAVTKEGNPYLRLKLSSGGVPMFANCFDSGMFDKIYAAKDSGASIVLDIAEAKVTNHEGKPLLNVVGFEHPGQGMLFGEVI